MAHPKPPLTLGTSESRLNALLSLLSWLVAGVAATAAPALRLAQALEKILHRISDQLLETVALHIATGRILMTGIGSRTQPTGRWVEYGLPHPPVETAAVTIPSQTASGVLHFGGISSAVVH